MPEIRTAEQNRSLRRRAINDMRQAWQEAIQDTSPGVLIDGVLDRLEQKYQANSLIRRPGFSNEGIH
jgi:hypothetical protein